MYRFTLYILILLIFTGCAEKVCGVDKELFNDFSKVKQEVICQDYIEAEKLREQRYMLEEQNRQKELELKQMKVEALYPCSDQAPLYSPVKVEVSGEVFYKKRAFKIYPVAFTLTDKEVRKICVNDRLCFWSAYRNGEVLINIEPADSKRHLQSYVGCEGDYRMVSQSVSIKPGKGRNTVRVRFRRDGALYDLRITIYNPS